ncbi:5'-3' exoribonuclease 2 [Wickerhamomyces ciferrii]|uniref:5'-3' exoribonuclease n=1 Tax=Wickerhamomyces ciferrii (strain ATCC 14091 / BCRC 22168 / CBS 111 / JCM 3599 / NBRC 0793 / NRRL Y-1031 F-60-10) TaxID=1206466 RepID=K0KWA0_WICCF|nr:5'-3' exoribonuclease 2 [Wickerhamomyces ciferrii]CCH45428.1 5'-3' exoribonuclease 2 [Wickerhamomyces ciferrii]
MGVPAFYRWLSRKYPKIISPTLEEDATVVDGVTVPPSYSNPNPNGELDNLYLDMNGIVHPCSHPENRPPPETEDEMLLAVFEYTDRVLNMARPRKVLMIAVDGVAPRAKMNQQRARRFRSARDAKIQDEERQRLQDLREGYGEVIDEAVKVKKTWDSNAITPGTPFMDKLALALRYWTAYKLSSDPGWKDLQVIISDATVPGEGEHKIMNFVRSQRSDIEYNPNTKHAIYGLDADLIFLGLATHEPHFRVLREDVFARDNKMMSVQEKMNLSEEHRKLIEEKESKKPFLWLNINVLREYLEIELNIPRLPFKFDLERAIDDWVFMCFFCGNDFLPHLPSLDVRDNSIDLLVSIWKQVLPKMKSYITCDGILNLENVEVLLSNLAPREADIFRQRQAQDQRRNDNDKRRKVWQEEDKIAKNQYLANVTKGKADKGTYTPVNNLPLFDVNNQSVGKVHMSNKELAQAQINAGKTPDATTDDSSAKEESETPQPEVKEEDVENANQANISAAAALRQKLLANKTKKSEDATIGEKRQIPDSPTDSAVSSDSEAADVDGDPVRLFEPGYHDRYYRIKFHISDEEVEATSKEVVKHYIEGISWVLLYYYQGCPSWNWYYPYHYAPFAQDFTNIKDLDIKFTQGKPFLPYEQLMSVLPAASGHNLPEIFRPLMSDADSPIIDFYPEDFPIDMNGKKMSWQGIVLLPFIDEKRLLEVVRDQYPKLTDAEKGRNVRKEDVVFLSKENKRFKEFKKLYSDSKKVEAIDFHFNKTGLCGKVLSNEKFQFDSILPCPIEGDDHQYNDLDTNAFLYADYIMPPKSHGKSIILTGYIKHKPVLSQEDKDGIVYGRGGGRRNYHDASQNIIETGPGSNSSYAPRFGGYKFFLWLAAQQQQQFQQQQNLKQFMNSNQNQRIGMNPTVQPSSSGNLSVRPGSQNLPQPSRNGVLRR